MKTFNNVGNPDSYDIVHMKGDKDKYTVTKNGNKLTYVSVDLDRTYIVDNVEEMGFKYSNGFSNIFKWTDEFSLFNSIIEPTSVSFSSYASASAVFAQYKDYGLWKISNLSGSCGLTINGVDSGNYGMGIAYGGRTILPSLELWGTGPSIYYYVGSGNVSFTIERLE